ncbi:MAG: ABC transporter ATP-binding protein [Clostridia bacterium]|nr:ABC transporter ATP-binding protein [Clostridia bacterium]
MGPGYGPPPGKGMHERMKEPAPKRIKDVPKYVKNVMKGTFRRLFTIFRLVWDAQPLILFTMIFMAVWNGVTPVISAWISARLLQAIADRIFDPSVNLLPPLILQFGFLFVRTLLATLNNVITRVSGELVTQHIKVKIMQKAKTVDVGSFDMPDFYERMENANREAGMRPIHILSSAFSAVSSVITLFSFGAVLFTLFGEIRETSGAGAYAFTVVFAVLFLILSIASAAVSFHFRKKNFLYMRHRSKDRRQLSYYSDTLVNKDLVKELRLFNLSDLFIGRYNEVFKNYFKGVKKLIYRENAWNLFLSMLSAACSGTLIYMIATNVRQIGSYSLYSSALNNISGAVSNLINVSSTIYEGTLFIDNLLLFFDEEQKIRCICDDPLPVKRHCGHRIELRHVSFSYPGSDKKVLSDVNLTLEPGDTVVLVGLNGAGKTTLIKLLTRLYDPTEGVILFDGEDIRKYDPKELYKVFGIIFQDFGKYAVTAGENISFGDIDKPATRENVERAGRLSGVDGYISRLPGGYDTPLTRYFEADGTELSIGQWQKLSVARAFYSDSDILILDEPTASLDPMAEQEIYNQFDVLRKDKTTVFVSHRLSSATVADKIVVLKEGRVVELGDHRTLMAQKGEYYTLFSTQAARYIAGDGETT